MIRSATLAALVLEGIAESAAELILERRCAFITERGVLVATPAVEPITGEQQLYVPWGAERYLDDTSALVNDLSQILATRPEISSIVYRIGLDNENAPRANGQLLMRYVQLTEREDVDVSMEEDWLVRGMAEEDRDMVKDLLRRALRAGYDGAERSPDPAAIDQLTSDLIGRVGRDVTVYCAFHGVDFVGHVTLVTDEDELTSAPFVEMIDMFVLEKWRRSSASRLLVEASARYARELKRPLIGHVVGDNPNADRVYANLLHSGWSPKDAYWQMPARSLSRRGL